MKPIGNSKGNKQKRRNIFPKRYRPFLGGLFLVCGLLYAFSLPKPLFDVPLSVVLEDQNGRLMGARIAADGQWRFPLLDSVPEKFAISLISFEDKRFWTHPGVDVRALGRAMGQNLRNGRIVSGGSTLSMQIIRLARGNRSRNVVQKFIEIILATRLELAKSKKEILNLYASYAPFGGNVVGLEAASWRYFGKQPGLLSWAEAATLAVLPNSPSLIHPGRNRELLLAKRNRLLDRIYELGFLDGLSWELAKSEQLPDKPYPLPRLAPHLLDKVVIENTDRDQARVYSTLDGDLQQKVNQLVVRHQERLAQNEIHNVAAMVMHIPTGEVLAYVGNASSAGAEHSGAVDIIQAPRSTGSILKPFLYTLMLQEGMILPPTLVADVPTFIGGYRPENFHRQYDGMVSAERALVRSLNVPMVLMLQDYSVEKFHFELNKLGFSFIHQPPDHYGLSLILGGAEASLWQITSAYAGMGRTLGHFYELDGRYAKHDFRPPHYRQERNVAPTNRRNALKEAPRLSAGAIWLSFEAMQQLERPDSEGEWEAFVSSRRIAWKTGTSFGFRDAWAVGLDPRFAVGVWAGNADGEGRPGLVGVQAAAPLLFEIFDLLPTGRWFDPPYDDLRQVTVCSESGFRPLPICPIDTIWGPEQSALVAACPFHQEIHLGLDGRWQMNQACAQAGRLQKQSWFVLPPAAEYYYKMKHPGYKSLPAFHPDCEEALAATANDNMQLIYPKQGVQIFLPLDLDGKLSETIFQAAHRQAETIIYWHLDQVYLGSTKDFHQLSLRPEPGKHTITLVDEYGLRLQQSFEILARE